MHKKKLAIVVTHPIQYYTPLFKSLAERENIEIKVFYTWGEDSVSKFDPGFGRKIEWDLPVLEGYSYEFLENTSPDPGSHHFKGIINPDAAKKIEKWTPDALLVYGWSYTSHLKLLRYFKGKCKILFRGDSNLIDEISGWKKVLRTLLLKWVYRHIDTALYVGSANKAYFLKYGLSEQQLIFAPHATDNARFSLPRNVEAKNLRRSFGLAEDDILLLFAGKFENKKAPLLLVEAFSAIEDLNAHLLFVGNGEQEVILKAEKEKNPNRNRVHFMDFQNQTIMPVIYQACDIFCLPSNGPGETWGLAVNEAMAAGKAIIVSDKVGCSQDLVKNNENGYIFESGNVEQLILAIKCCLQNYKQMGEFSKGLIQDWTFLKQAEVIENAVG